MGVQIDPLGSIFRQIIKSESWLLVIFKDQ